MTTRVHDWEPLLSLDIPAGSVNNEELSFEVDAHRNSNYFNYVVLMFC